MPDRKMANAPFERLVNVGGVRFRLLEAGEGPALILLHGSSSVADHFRDLMPLLAVRFRVVAFDQRGFGGTTGARDMEIGHDAWAADVIAICDELAIEVATLLGWSLGAAIAINVAARHPNRVAALVLVGASDPARKVDVAFLRGRLEARRLMSRSELEASLRSEFAGRVHNCSRPELLDRLVQESIASDAGNMSRIIDAYARPGDQALAASKVICPVRLIAGDVDPFAPPLAARALAKHLRAASVDVLPDCGHYAAIECPEELARLILERLAVQE